MKQKGQMSTGQTIAMHFVGLGLYRSLILEASKLGCDRRIPDLFTVVKLCQPFGK